MIQHFRTFLTDLRGAVSTDWIVLCFAMLVILGFVMTMAEDGSVSLVDSTVGAMTVERALLATTDQPPGPP